MKLFVLIIISNLSLWFLGISLIEAQTLNVNTIDMSFLNDGHLDEITPESMYQASTWQGWNVDDWRKGAVYDHGLWITGKRNGAVGCLPVVWRSGYSPGPVINSMSGSIVNPQDTLRYRVYKIAAGDSPQSNQDFKDWPSDLGAPIDEFGNPKILGNQMVFSIYNGADTAVNRIPYFNWHNLPPRAQLPVEIRHIAFEHFGEYSDTSIWANSIFFEWGIYNKGPDVLDSVYLTLWSDIDFLESFDNPPGVDTAFQTGYCWDLADSTYGCVGYTLLFGPAIASTGDTATFFGKQKPGYKNLPLSSFFGIGDDSYPDGSLYGPPYSTKTAWNVTRGLMQNGQPMIDSVTRLPTKFEYSGDPITHNGSLWPFPWTGGGAGIMMTMGPVTIASGDSQWVMMALIPSIKLNGIDAINRMRTNAQYLRSLPYDSLISLKPRRDFPTNPLPTFTLPESFRVYPSYPNPFNSETVISFDLPEASSVSIEIFNELGGLVTSKPDQAMSGGLHKIRWNPAASSGIYFIRITAHSLVSGTTWNGINKVVLIH